MEYFLRFAYPAMVYILVPVVVLLAWLRWRHHKGVRYRYSLGSTLKQHKMISQHPHKKIFFSLRFVSLLLFAFLMGKPQLVDPKSTIKVEGIDIALVLDVSDSMSLPHHADDERTRIDVAKEEAIRFVEKRTNDAVGLVVFGNDALTRCPLTADKKMLKNLINDVQIGIVDHNGTLLSTAVVTAANRLKNSKAKSRIMILLTDGEPTGRDIDPKMALDIAKELSIKIYTIGIGSDQEITLNHPFYGSVAVKTTLNKELLTTMAEETGGKFFEAKDAQDMRAVYDAIDKLEKAEIDTPIFTRYYDIFMPFVWLVFLFIFFDLLLSAFVWFSI